jgi:hypothetical protein
MHVPRTPSAWLSWGAGGGLQQHCGPSPGVQAGACSSTAAPLRARGGVLLGGGRGVGTLSRVRARGRRGAARRRLRLNPAAGHARGPLTNSAHAGRRGPHTAQENQVHYVALVGLPAQRSWHGGPLPGRGAHGGPRDRCVDARAAVDGWRHGLLDCAPPHSFAQHPATQTRMSLQHAPAPVERPLYTCTFVCAGQAPRTPCKLDPPSCRPAGSQRRAGGSSCVATTLRTDQWCVLTAAPPLDRVAAARRKG